jgi:hypothetical protein
VRRARQEQEKHRERGFAQGRPTASLGRTTGALRWRCATLVGWSIVRIGHRTSEWFAPLREYLSLRISCRVSIGIRGRRSHGLVVALSAHRRFREVGRGGSLAS